MTTQAERKLIKGLLCLVLFAGAAFCYNNCNLTKSTAIPTTTLDPVYNKILADAKKVGIKVGYTDSTIRISNRNGVYEVLVRSAPSFPGGEVYLTFDSDGNLLRMEGGL